MSQSWLLLFALAAGCVGVDATDDSEDTDLSDTEQAVWDGSGEAEGETIVVQSGLDLCWAGRCWPSHWPTDPGPHSDDGGHGESGVGHGGGGAPRGKTGPHPGPERVHPGADLGAVLRLL